MRPVPGYSGLFAVRIDQKESVEAYKAKILSQAAASGHTGEMLAVVQEELESPCTEEMAVFEEFSGLVERDDFDVVVLDTAPTGHTLRLLELPYDYARQVEMMVAVRKDDAGATGAKGKLDALVRRLKDPRATTFLLVIYPEYTPIFEAKRAAEDLKESGIEVQGVIANFILEEDDCSSPFSMSRYSHAAALSQGGRGDVPAADLQGAHAAVGARGQGCPGPGGQGVARNGKHRTRRSGNGGGNRRRGKMKVKEFVEQFKSLSKEDQMAVIRQIMPGFCEGMMGDPKRIREMFSLMTEDCGEQMANMISVMGMMMGRKGGGCCG